MPVARRRNTGFCLLALLAAVPACLADTLSVLPEPLAGKLQPVAEIGLDSLDADSRAQLEAARQRVAAAIGARTPDAELADAYGELGALYQVQFVYRPAEACYRNAIQLAPDEFRWRYYAAYLAASTGEMDKAVAGFEKARQLRPDYLAVTLRLADALLELNRLDSAKAAYLQVMDAEGLQAAAHYGLGQIALLARDYPAAIGSFTRALDLQPDADRVHYPLARALHAAGRGDAARQHMARMGDRLPSVTDPQIESLQSLKQGSRVHFIHGMKAYRQRDYTAAQQAFARGLEREPGNTSARISYARALYLSDHKQQARRELETVLATEPSRALAGYLLGVLSEEAGETEAAVRRYRQVIGHDPDHPGAHLQLAHHAWRNGRYELAVRHYARSRQGAPENPALYPPYAGALLQSGASSETVRRLVDAALQRFPEHPVLAYLQIQLQACSSDAPGCDAATALARASRLAGQQRIPAHRELQALTFAASGDFETAAQLQQDLVSESIWTMPFETARLAGNLERYQAEQLPGFEQMFTWSLLQAPTVQGISAFRDYPAARPY